jgi:uncharacterized protein (TIGR00369 family)
LPGNDPFATPRTRPAGKLAVGMATWRSGYAADCKSAYPSSILGVASIFLARLIFMEIPAGFEPFSRMSPVTEPWAPIYARRTSEAVVLAVRLAEAHTNSRGVAHGGFISTLADQAMGSSLVAINLDPEKQTAITVNLSVDFVGSAKVGQWVEFTTTFIKVGSTICFTQCFVTADGAPVARANATFRVVERAA